MSDLDFIPSHLRSLSRSKTEIVLDFLDVNEAINYLLHHDIAISGWEGRIFSAQGVRLDSIDYPGSGQFYPKPGESISQFARRTGIYCRQTIREQYDKWMSDPRSLSERLAFCIYLLDQIN